MTYTLIKIMERELTEEEKQEILKYMIENEDVSIIEVILIFEKKYKTPITETCMGKIIVDFLLR